MSESAPAQLDELRQETHNTSCDTALAAAALCGFVHLPTGATCLLPARHDGPCQFATKDAADAARDQINT